MGRALRRGAGFDRRPLTHCEAHLKKRTKQRREKTDDLRSGYALKELKAAVRDKFVKRFRAGTNLVLLHPDVYKVFRTEKAINDALRLVIKLCRVSNRH
jgi:hypothetical protein